MQTTIGKIFGIGLITALLVLTAFTLEGAAARAVKKEKKQKPGTIYIQQDKQTINLIPGELTFRTALVLANNVQVGRYGTAKEPALKVATHQLEIMLFDPESAGEKVHLTRLGFVETNPASSFDLNSTKLDPEFFQKAYKMDYNAAISINLWCFEEDIPLQMTPVPKKPGWFRLVPTAQLPPGNYSITTVGLDGPRYYTGEHPFYPFNLAAAAPPPEVKAAPKKMKKAVKRRKAAPEPPACPPPARPPAEVKAPEPAPPAALAAGFTYQWVAHRTPRIRREYQITNLNDHAWHNVQIKIYARSVDDGKFVLGPVTQEKNIVLPGHTVNQAPDQTFMHYETLNDAGYNLYLEISAKEGTLKRAWKNVSGGDSSDSNLMEIPWDLEDKDK
jgi:hypothetical protein